MQWSKIKQDVISVFLPLILPHYSILKRFKHHQCDQIDLALSLHLIPVERDLDRSGKMPTMRITIPTLIITVANATTMLAYMATPRQGYNHRYDVSMP